MAVLIEALCLVIPTRRLDESWPGGADAFLQAMCEPGCPARRVMHDTRLVSVSVLTCEAAESVAARLCAVGLVHVATPTGPFVDFAVVDQQYGPILPTPWLDWSTARGITRVWLASEDAGELAVPDGWTPEQSRALLRHDVRDEPRRLLKLADGPCNLEVWLDTHTGAIGHDIVRRGTPRVLPGEWSGPWLVGGTHPAADAGGDRRALDARLDEILDLGLDTFVDLTVAGDACDDYLRRAMARGAARGVYVIVLRSAVPSADDEGAVASAVALVTTLLERRRKVYVHGGADARRAEVVVDRWDAVAR